MKANTPEVHRAEAVRQGKLANEAKAHGDYRQADRHLERARDLVILALKLEQDESSTA